jgi:drug/metabolite transporter (DMT)-like permease
MSALLLVLVAAFFVELSTSIGKEEVASKKETLYAVAFLGGIWTTVILVSFAFISSSPLVFSLQSIPTFGLRAVLEIALVFISISAIQQADRSTFSFLRMLTIPLLLIVDFLLGYALSALQILGVFFIMTVPLYLFHKKGMSKKGKLLSLSSAILAVATISLYKFNITHFNSVEAEQAMMYVILLVTIILTAWLRGHENVFRYLTHPLCIVQSLSAGVAGVCMSFAYAFAPASLVVALKRSFELLTSLLSGKILFHEKQFIPKVFASCVAILGIVLISIAVI